MIYTIGHRETYNALLITSHQFMEAENGNLVKLGRELSVPTDFGGSCPELELCDRQGCEARIMKLEPVLL